MKRYMVDIETFGNGPQSAIVSIGAADFDSERLFYTNVDLESCLRAGLKVDAGTIAWWMQQSDAARGALFKDSLLLCDALDALARWLGAITEDNADGSETFKPVECELWAYPASFDLVIIENACRAVGQRVPWHYRAPRCLRTLAAVSGVPKPHETPHDACRDARMQVDWAKACLKALGKEP